MAVGGFMNILWFILSCLGGYLLGSIPFAIVIGKVFYKTDIRKHGSGNPGGTNAGRVLGKKAGVSVIVLDALKVVAAIWIGSFVSPACALVSGLCCCVGHCYPVFAHFKGGKAVASMYGFLFGISVFVFHNGLYFLIPILMFFIILYLYKWVSVASICAALSSSLQIMSMNWSANSQDILLIAGSWMMTALIIYRHRANIVKVRSNKESRVTWI